MPLPQLPGSLYISLRTCFLTKIIIIHINSSFSASFLRNAGKNSLFHTVGYKNHSVGYIFHTVKYKSRTVKQRICKEISKNTCPELQLILPANQSDEVSGAYSCNVNSPRSTPNAFMANAPISSSPGITTIGARPSSHSRNPWMQ